MLCLPLRIHCRRILIIKLEFHLAAEGGGSASRDLHDFGFHSFDYFRVVCTERPHQDGIIWDNVKSGSCLKWGYREDEVLFWRDHSCLYGVQGGNNWWATADYIFWQVWKWGVTTLPNDLDLNGCGAGEHGPDNCSDFSFRHSRWIVEAIDLIYSNEAALFYHWFCTTSAFFSWLEKEAHYLTFRYFWAILNQYLGGSQQSSYVAIMPTHVSCFHFGSMGDFRCVFFNWERVHISSEGNCCHIWIWPYFTPSSTLDVHN